MKGLVWNDQMSLGLESMDKTHREFVELLASVMELTGKPGFGEQLAEMLEHTRAHFAAEESLMAEVGFPAINEHKGEHARVLNELTHFHARAAAGRTALLNAYLRDQLPSWFMDHLRTIDAETASYVRQVRESTE